MPKIYAVTLCLLAALAACGSDEEAAPGGGGGSGAAGAGAGNPGGEPVIWSTDFSPIALSAQDWVNAQPDSSAVSGGIPFARGALDGAKVQRLALADSDGNRIAPFGASVLGSWPDGSVKWLLLDFDTSLVALQEHSFTLGLIDAPDEASAFGVTVTEEATHFVITTGSMKAHLPKQQFGFLSAVWVDHDGDGAFATGEQIVASAGEMFIDLDDASPGAQDGGVSDYPAADYRGMEGGSWLRDSGSKSATRYKASDAQYEAQLFRSNPAHTVFKLSGWHRQEGGSREFGKYALYLHFYAGQSYVKASHTWIMTGDPKNNFVRRMGISVPLKDAAGDLNYAFGGPVEASAPAAGGPSDVMTGSVDAAESAGIYSIGPDKYYHNISLGEQPGVEFTVLKNDAPQSTGMKASGWADISKDGWGVAAGVRNFWREHPKEVAYADGALTAYIWPDHGDKALDLRRRYDEVRGTVSQGWGKAARREFNNAGSAVGVAKSTDLFFYFHSGNHTDAKVDDTFRTFQDAPRPFVSGKHNVDTGVFGPLVAYDPVGRAQIENYLDLMIARINRSQEEYGWVGMYDYGNYLPEFGKQSWELQIADNPNLFSNWGYAGWQQENYRYGAFGFVQYFRSGRPHYWRLSDTWLRHARDVDCVFWEKPDDGPRPNDNRTAPRVGGGHRHDQQHWGTYMASYGIPSIAVVHHYYMTGDGRDLDAMRDYISWNQGQGDYYEKYGEYAVYYMAEAVGDSAAITWADAHTEKPQSAFGRATYDSGMGLMFRDIQTGGDPAIRAKLRIWADLDESSAAFLKGYLEGIEKKGTYTARIQSAWDAAFPASAVKAATYSGWAKRTPSDLRDAMSADIMPNGPWQLPMRTIEQVQFDGPGGMGNDPGRHATQMALMWLMHAVK